MWRRVTNPPRLTAWLRHSMFLRRGREESRPYLMMPGIIFYFAQGLSWGQKVWLTVVLMVESITFFWASLTRVGR